MFHLFRLFFWGYFQVNQPLVFRANSSQIWEDFLDLGCPGLGFVRINGDRINGLFHHISPI